MNSEKYFPWATGLYRVITGRLARRLYLALLVLLLIFTTSVRIRTVLLTRQIHAVLSGLEQVRVDQTTEEQLLKTVPYLVRNDYEGHVGTSVEHFYGVVVSNEDDLTMLIYRPLSRLLQITVSSETGPFGRKALDWLGYRYLRFGASVVVLDGKVSSIGYGIAPQLVFPRQLGEIVSVRSVHGFWQPYRRPISVSSIDDETPEYQVKGTEKSLSVTYTFDAPLELSSHAFQVDLSCFWGIRGCVSVRQLAPLLWQDKQAIEAATVSRLKDRNPCPDRVLAGRVRYLPDLNVELLEVVNSRREDVNEEGERAVEFITDYRLKEVIRGRSGGPWTGLRYKQLIPSLLARTEQMANPVSPLHKAGDRVLFFSGASFDSCQMVPATPSAESAVRNAVPAPKRREDEMGQKLL